MKISGKQIDGSLTSKDKLLGSAFTETVNGVDQFVTRNFTLSSIKEFVQGSVATDAVDLKSNGGIVRESDELAIDLGASSITGQLANSDLANSSITINGAAISLGGTVTTPDTQLTDSEVRGKISVTGGGGSYNSSTGVITIPVSVATNNVTNASVSSQTLTLTREGASDVTFTPTANDFTNTLKTKLDGIESSATADQTASEIRALVEAATDSNVFTDADHTKLNGIEASATADQSDSEIKTAYENNSDTNAFTDALLSKLNGIEASATADQSNAEIRAAVEAATDSNVFTDDDHSKLNGIEANATADQTNTEIRDAVEAATDSNTFTDADHTKLNSVETNADVTDMANVRSALNNAMTSNTLTIGDSNTTTTFPGDIVVTGTTTTNNVQTVSTSNGVIFEGSAANDHEVTLLAGTVSADRTATLPDATGTIVLHDATQTLTNKTITGIIYASDTSTAVTQSTGDNSTKIATTAYVDAHDGAKYDLSIPSSTTTIRLAASGSETGNDDIALVAGSNITLTRDSASQLTIAASGGTTTFQVEDGDGTEKTISNAKELKFAEGTGDGASIDINFGSGDGSDGSPFDLSFAVTNTDKGSSQSIFKTIAVSGQDDVVADSNSDTLTFAAGSNVTLTTNATSDTITIASDDTNTQNVFTSSFVDSSSDALLRLTKSGASSGTQDIKFVAGSNIALTPTDANNLTIAATNTTYSPGSGLDLSGTTFSVDVSDFLSGGTQYELVTAGGADSFVAESTLTYKDGFFTIQGNAGGNTPTITQGLAIGWNDSNGSREVDFLMQSGLDDHATNTMFFASYNGSTTKNILKLGGHDTETSTYVNVYGFLDVVKDKLRIGSTAVTTTAAELNVLDGFTGATADLTYAKDLRATGVTTTEFDKLDGLTASTTELNVLDGITSTTTELNKLDGFTGDATDLNYAKELYDTGVTSTEFNTALDGITASATELNKLDGVTAGTVSASKAVVADSNKDVTGFRNITLSGTLDATSITTDGLTNQGDITIANAEPMLFLNDTTTNCTSTTYTPSILFRADGSNKAVIGKKGGDSNVFHVENYDGPLTVSGMQDSKTISAEFAHEPANTSGHYGLKLTDSSTQSHSLYIGPSSSNTQSSLFFNGTTNALNVSRISHNNSLGTLLMDVPDAGTSNISVKFRQYNTGGYMQNMIDFEDDGDIKNINGSYGTISSDRRVKENIVDATPKLNDILSLNVKNFNFIGDNKKQIGLIAQDVESVFPSWVQTSDTRIYKTHDENGVPLEEQGELVSGLADGKSLKVGMEFAVLVKTIQELNAKIVALEAKVQTLENN